jgi:hypothetical protein
MVVNTPFDCYTLWSMAQSADFSALEKTSVVKFPTTKTTEECSWKVAAENVEIFLDANRVRNGGNDCARKNWPIRSGSFSAIIALSVGHNPRRQYR